MPEYLPGDVDASTIHLTIDAPFRENLEGLIYMARVKARTMNKVVLVYHELQQGAVVVEGVSPQVHEVIAVKDFEPDFFNKLVLQCPRAADIEFEEQQKKPRPFPSILVNPQGKVAVSKPSLCDSCVHRLQKGAFGHCHQLQFTPLAEVA